MKQKIDWLKGRDIEKTIKSGWVIKQVIVCVPNSTIADNSYLCLLEYQGEEKDER